MSKVKLCILEVDAAEYERDIKLHYWEKLAGRLGSEPRFPGQVVEGVAVPVGKVWLFPLGRNFDAVEAVIKGTRIVKSVEV